MHNTANVLVSNIALPNSGIGSWSTRMSRLIQRNPEYFSYILSPSKATRQHIFCKKRKFITWKASLRTLQLIHWVAKDYIKAIRRLSKTHTTLTVIVMDDPHLLEAITMLKSKLSCKLIVIYSFHGYQLTINPEILTLVDKMLWLSKAGIKKSKPLYSGYFPDSVVVGNAVNSDIFFPLAGEALQSARMSYGYTMSDRILIWMANDRPKKGFHIFENVVKQLLAMHRDLKIITIGTTKRIEHPNVNNIGRISNNQVATYLQLGDYYMFTTLYEEGFGLSMIEAYKCGNAVIASALGAIPEALENRTLTYLIRNPESIDQWVEAFNTMIQGTQQLPRLSAETSKHIWSYEDWENKFKLALSLHE